MPKSPLVHPTGEFDALPFLEGIGCVAPPTTRTRTRYQTIIAVLVGLAILIPVLYNAKALKDAGIDINLGNLLTGLGVFVAVVQWHSSLEQQALDKYEGEVNAANQLSDSKAVRTMMNHHYPNCTTDDDYLRARYVYRQLDSLEFEVERYVQGFASAYTTSRAVMTFYNRCTSKEFRERATAQLAAASYSPLVRCVANAIISRPQPNAA